MIESYVGGVVSFRPLGPASGFLTDLVFVFTRILLGRRAMPSHVQCPSCGKTFEAPEADGHASITCPLCKRIFESSVAAASSGADDDSRESAIWHLGTLKNSRHFSVFLQLRERETLQWHALLICPFPFGEIAHD